MTRYEYLSKIADELVERGRNSSPGIREYLFKEAEAIREVLDYMAIEDAEFIFEVRQ